MSTIKVNNLESSSGGGVAAKLTSVNGGAIGTRNLIINGAMQVAARSVGVTGITSSGYYTVDRFAISLSSLGTWTQSQSTTVPSGKGFSKSLKMDVTTADSSPAAGDFCAIQYKIEAQDLQLLKYGTSSAETITLKFHVRSPKTGTHIVHIYQNDGNRHIAKAYTISSADTFQEVTINIEGDTGGTINDDNGIGLQVEFFLGAGTNFTSGALATSWAGYTQANSAVGQVNCADNTANNFFITGVQLELGEVATAFQFQTFDEVRRQCYRYFQKVRGGIGTAGSSSQVNGVLIYRPMRTDPSLSKQGTSDYQYGDMIDQGRSTSSTPTFFRNDGLHGHSAYRLTGFSGMTTGEAMRDEGAGGDAAFGLDAEL